MRQIQLAKSAIYSGIVLLQNVMEVSDEQLAEVIPRIFNLHLRLWFFISNKIGSWHPIAEAHEEMTKGVVQALARHDPDEAELAMKIYISRRHQDIRDIL